MVSLKVITEIRAKGEEPGRSEKGGHKQMDEKRQE